LIPECFHRCSAAYFCYFVAFFFCFMSRRAPISTLFPYTTLFRSAVVISITAFALGVLWGLIGGVITIFYRPSDGSPLSMEGMETEIGEIEHQIEEEERAS